VATDLLVVGLGNPGADYARTRHNVGAEVVELLAARHGGRLKKSKERAFTTEVRIDGRRVALAVPMVYMNDSGIAVRKLLKRYDVAVDRLVVVHDELDLPPAALKIKVGGGLAGHNGLRSIVIHVKSDEFLRVRIGVGKPLSKERGAHHVLARFGKAERAAVDATLRDAADAVEMIALEGVEAAMNHYNTRDRAG
jgi:PTH1 family peptidyl-tRNA hydrolase